MKPYLVDVPVVLKFFVRRETLQRVFQVVKTARPSVLFLISDGPRESVVTDRDDVAACRAIVEEVDWECQVHRLYSEVNLGMYATSRMAREYILDRVDRYVFLEDDVVPSVSFFSFCADLLELYKDDLRINMICGMNHLGVYGAPNADYFFTKAASIWGFAVWRRSHQLFGDLNYGSDTYSLNRLLENERSRDVKRQITGYLRDPNYGGHPAGPEFWLRLANLAQSQLNIVASRNMICNVGYGSGSAHAGYALKEMPRPIRNLFEMKTYEYDEPVRHPRYVIEDRTYLESVYRLMGVNRPLVRAWRTFESVCRRWAFGDRRLLASRVVSRILRSNRIES